MKNIKYKLIIMLLPIFSLATSIQTSLKDVTVQLHWKHSFEFAGFYIAKKMGYYKDVGLNVKLKEWDNSIDIIQDIVNNKSQYAIVGSSSLIDASLGKKIIYLSVLYQSSPLIVLADKSSNIRSIKDFKNKKIMLNKDHMQDMAIASMLTSQGVSYNDMKIIKHSFNTHDLLNKKVDLMAAYISNEPFTLQEAGGNPRIFRSQEYGFDFYNDFLITSQKYAKMNPTEVSNFKKATIRGYEYAFAHMSDAVNLIYRKYNSLNKSKKALKYAANILKKLAYYKTKKIGTIKIEQMKKMYDMYKLLNLIHTNINIKNIIFHESKNLLNLTEDELLYLKNKKQISTCVDPDWMPYVKLNKEGKQIGISPDYLKIIEKMLSITFKVVKTSTWTETIQFAKDKKCEIISLIMKTPTRESYLNFTVPYIRIPIVAATQTTIPFLESVENLRNKSIGIIKDFAYVEIFKNKYPFLNIVEVKSIDQGLEKVSKGEIFAFVDSLQTIVYKMQMNQSENLKISGKLHENWELSMATQKDNDILRNILNKAIANVSMQDKRDIFNKWISIKYEAVKDYSLIWKVLLFSCFVITIFIYWNRKISKRNKLLKDAQKEIEEKNEELKKLATTDKLTGLYNRLKIDEVLKNEIQRANRYNSTFGIAILDVDYFKTINDTYGHQVGDMVLVQISYLLQNTIRKTDFIGRWGGEEFLIVCPLIQKEGIIKMMENLKAQIHTMTLIKDKQITSSFGVTMYIKNDTLQTIIKRADDALYEAKRSGRNKIIVQ